MIVGVWTRTGKEKISGERIESSLYAVKMKVGAPQVRTWSEGAFGYCSPYSNSKYQELQPTLNLEQKTAIVVSGRIYNEKELWQGLANRGRKLEGNCISHLMVQLYQVFGLDFVKMLNGKFAFAIWDGFRNQLVAGRDRFGIEPLYYYLNEHHVVLGSFVESILDYTGESRVLNNQALARFLLFNYNPGLQTIYERIHRLRPAHLLIVTPTEIEFLRYWKPTFKARHEISEERYAEELLHHLRRAVTLRLDNDASPGMFLSGGLDSSTMLALTREKVADPLRAYSYRCLSESFDESPYARRMAEYAQAIHHEIEYEAKHVLSMPEIVKAMNEPFCDVGINIATYLLGREASQRESYIFTGDGGDELFGGHPIYEADQIARYVEMLPRSIRKGLSSLLAYLPDSNKKKPLSVKLKRFFENVSLPSELLSHRWRMYYQTPELSQLLVPDLAQEINGEGLYQELLDINTEGDGEDLLSRSLYSDYQTIVEFYLRRNDLNRLFGLEMRFPMFDHQLVDFCATLPSNLKVKGWSDAKYIFKKAIDKVLPHAIVYRKDKLGHSIPLKNWLREQKDVREFVLDYLSIDVIKKRGMFNVGAVQALIAEHMENRRNNSHRLWGLAVLEMWMQEHLDARA